MILLLLLLILLPVEQGEKKQTWWNPIIHLIPTAILVPQQVMLATLYYGAVLAKFFVPKKLKPLFLIVALGILIGVTLFQSSNPVWKNWVHLAPSNFDTWMLDAAIAMLATWPCQEIVGALVGRWENDPNLQEEAAKSLAGAGAMIGVLERLFVFTFMIMGKLEGVGFVLAAKSVFRIGDLKDAEHRKRAEYVFIGTLASFGLAMMLGGLIGTLKPGL